MSILQESENEFSNVSKTDSELDWHAHEESQQIGHSYIATGAAEESSAGSIIKHKYGYFIGIGSNLNPVMNFQEIIRRLVTKFGRIELSRIFKTEPVAIITNNAFLNAVAYLESHMEKDEIKKQFNRIETELGRDRLSAESNKKDRPADLDILTVIVAGSRHVEESQITEEIYYRPSMIELLLTMKFDCSIQYSASDDATEIKVDNASVGLKPSTITLKNETNKLEIRLKHAALVTGAAVRLGKAIALTLAEQGYDIALHYNTGEEEAMKTATEIRSLGVNCSTFQYNFMDIKNIPNFIDHIINTYPYVDVLVNNASVYDSGTIMQTTDSMFDRQWTINFKAPFFLSKEFARHVKHGNIINMLDNKIFFNQFQYSAYLISKKALYEFTKMASIEFAPKIRVNAIAPGMILPPTERTIEYLEWRKQGIPLQKCGDVRDICAAIITLLTNTFINGHIMVVDGGESRNSTGRNVIAYNDGNI